MIHNIFSILIIAAGILLASNTLKSINGIGEHTQKLAQWLLQFKNPIAWAAFVGGIIYLVAHPSCMIYDVVGIFAGLILLEDDTKKIPAVGDTLAVWSEKAAEYQTPAGIAAIAVGVLGLLNINFC